MSRSGRLSRDGLTDPAPVRLVVDPVACEGIGMCSHLASQLIGVDSWGFPVMPASHVPVRDLRAARAAISGCPRNALFLTAD